MNGSQHVAFLAVLSLSGAFAAQGMQAQRGLTLWGADVNAAGGLVVRDRGGAWPVELVIYDDASRAAQATDGTERLLSDEHVDLLIGPYSSLLTLAVTPVAERHGKVLWAPWRKAAPPTPSRAQAFAAW